MPASFQDIIFHTHLLEFGMASIDPQKLSGEWNSGYALDLHTIKSEFLGYNSYGHPEFDTTYTELEIRLLLTEILQPIVASEVQRFISSSNNSPPLGEKEYYFRSQ